MARILIITQHFPPDNSGNASRIYDLSKYLVQLGCDIIVISPFPSFPHGMFKQRWKLYLSQTINQIIHLSIFTLIPTKPNPSFANRVAYYLFFPLHAFLWALFYRDKYDIIISTAPPIFTGIPGLLMQKLLGKKFVYDVRDLWIQASVSLGFTPDKGLFTRISRKYEHILFQKSDLITVTTNEIKKDIIKTLSIEKSKVKVIPNGVDVEKFIFRSKKKPRIIYTGNIGHAQDLKKVIQAVKRINETRYLEFYIVGGGDITDSLQDYINEEKLNHVVKLTGVIERTEIPLLLSESMIGIAPLKNLPSLRYALPTKVYEYMAAGIPFIATGKGEIEYLVKKTNAGVIANNTIESIQSYIEVLIENKEKRNHLGKNGLNFAKSECNRRNIAKKFNDLLIGLNNE